MEERIGRREFLGKTGRFIGGLAAASTGAKLIGELYELASPPVAEASHTKPQRIVYCFFDRRFKRIICPSYPHRIILPVSTTNIFSITITNVTYPPPVIYPLQTVQTQPVHPPIDPISEEGAEAFFLNWLVRDGFRIYASTGQTKERIRPELNTVYINYPLINANDRSETTDFAWMQPDAYRACNIRSAFDFEEEGMIRRNREFAARAGSKLVYGEFVTSPYDPANATLFYLGSFYRTMRTPRARVPEPMIVPVDITTPPLMPSTPYPTPTPSSSY